MNITKIKRTLAVFFNYPNKAYWANKNAGTYHRRIDKSTVSTRWECFKGNHDYYNKNAGSLVQPAVYLCHHCYQEKSRV